MDVCIWERMGYDYDYGIEWKPSCYEKIPEHFKTLSNQFYPEYDPEAYEFIFCPYCGKPMVIKENIT